MAYQIISDGCCDLTQDIVEQYHLRIVPFYISFDYENYYKEIEEIGIREVYDRMVNDPNVFPKTSLPSVQNYVDIFTEYAKQNIPVICLCFTVSLSGSYNSACNAMEIVKEEYPEAKITVIDTQAATVSQALMVIEAARMHEAGVSYEDCVDVINKMKASNHIFFTVGNLDYLKKGGRIGKVASIAAGALSLKPMIVLEDGVISSGGVARGRKKSYVKCCDLVKKYFQESGEDPKEYNFLVGYGYDIEEGEIYRSCVEEKLQAMGILTEGKIPSTQIGATIAVHTGPQALGVGCVKQYEYYL